MRLHPPSRTLACAIAAAALTAPACSDGGGGGQDGPAAGASPAALERLGLTREVPAAIREGCERAEEESTLAVRCPPVVPEGDTRVQVAGPLGRTTPSSYTIHFESAAIDDPESRGHWIVESGAVGALDPRHAGEDPAVRTAEIEVAGREATVRWIRPYEDGGGSHGNHVVVRWRQDGRDHAVSLHGHHNLERARAIATGLMGATPRAHPGGRWRLLPVRERHPTRGLRSVDAVGLGERALFVAGGSPGPRGLPGVAFDVADDRWIPLSGSPLRETTRMALVATGDEAIAWGGVGPAGYVGHGWAYGREDGRWREIVGAPLMARSAHTGVWTGERMIVWGGLNLERRRPFGDGAAYDPESDDWERIARAPIRGRANHTAVWTGDRMVVWGGNVAPGRPADGWRADGAAYDPATDRWSEIAPAPISATSSATAVWTGERMLVWTGRDGAAYDPAAGRWTRLPDSPLPVQRRPTAVWSGDELLVWGGVRRPGARRCPPAADGAAYDPAADRWRCLPPSPLGAREGHAAVALDGGMIVWGGCCSAARRGMAPYPDGAIYRTR